MLEEIANLLSFDDVNPFRVRAYRRAARTVRSSAQEMAALVERGEDLKELPTIGEDISALIDEAVRTGSMRSLEALRSSSPAIAYDLLEIEGIGPKKARALWENLGIGNLEQLHRAVIDQRVRDVPGFGEVSERRLAAALERVLHPAKTRLPIGHAEPIVSELLDYLETAPSLSKVQIAGSFRRGRETVGDLDIVAAAADHPAIIQHFLQWRHVKRKVSAGDERATVILSHGIQVDLRVVDAPSWGAALLYFTGSKDHSIRLRTLAKRRRLKLNEYGLWRGKQSLAGSDEDGIYRALGLRYIPPELRENRGEIELAGAKKLPKLVEADDMVGDLHLVARSLDDVTALVDAAVQLGWHYIGVGPQASGVARGDLSKLLKDISNLARQRADIEIFSAIEVDITEDGSLDVPPAAIEADLIIGSVQNGFRLSRADQTTRLNRALKHPAISILSHPTGRRTELRAPYDVELGSVADTAAKCGVALELSADPDRLDLSDRHCKLAIESGALISISTEAQTPTQLTRMALGVRQARRGWLEPNMILNTRPIGEIERFLLPHRAVSAVLNKA
jgi:DNA polymerase (family 10)